MADIEDNGPQVKTYYWSNCQKRMVNIIETGNKNLKELWCSKFFVRLKVPPKNITNNKIKRFLRTRLKAVQDEDCLCIELNKDVIKILWSELKILDKSIIGILKADSLEEKFNVGKSGIISIKTHTNKGLNNLAYSFFKTLIITPKPTDLHIPLPKETFGCELEFEDVQKQKLQFADDEEDDPESYQYYDIDDEIMSEELNNDEDNTEELDVDVSETNAENNEEDDEEEEVEEGLNDSKMNGFYEEDNTSLARLTIGNLVGNALIATFLLKEMAKNEHDQGKANKLKKYSNIYQDTAIKIVKSCYEENIAQTWDLLLQNIPHWNESCITIALKTKNKQFTLQDACFKLNNAVWKSYQAGETIYKVDNDFSDRFFSPKGRCRMDIISYLLFLTAYSVLLVTQLSATNFNWIEVIVMFYIIVFLVKEYDQWCRTRYKFDPFNILDHIAIAGAIIAWILRWIAFSNPENPRWMDTSRYFFSFDFILYAFRFMEFFYGTKFLGPIVVMIRHMVKTYIRILLILMIFLVAYSVASESLLYPESQLNSETLYYVFRKGFWAMIGEYSLDELEAIEYASTRLLLPPFSFMLYWLRSKAGNPFIMNRTYEQLREFEYSAAQGIMSKINDKSIRDDSSMSPKTDMVDVVKRVIDSQKEKRKERMLSDLDDSTEELSPKMRKLVQLIVMQTLQSLQKERKEVNLHDESSYSTFYDPPTDVTIPVGRIAEWCRYSTVNLRVLGSILGEAHGIFPGEIWCKVVPQVHPALNGYLTLSWGSKGGWALC
ncbi:hypothetical protein Btru_045503 [Bulinus truncatus]|nr:hypothetical protein Btru_045503 [Bulinus truncatus]